LAFATLNHPAVALFEAVVVQHERIIKTRSVQDISNICWAVAKSGHSPKPEALFKAVASQHARIAKGGNPQELSNLCWAFATVGVEHIDNAEVLFDSIADQQMRIAKNGSSQDLSSTCRAFATAGYKAEALFEVVAKQHDRIVKGGSVQHMSDFCWAFATVGHKAEELFEVVAKQHDRIVKGGSVQELSEICWAFATLGVEAKELFVNLATQQCELGRLVESGNEQNVASTLWSFAIAGHVNEGKGLVGGLWKRVCDGRLQFNDEQLQQLALFYAAVQIEGGANLDLEPTPESLLVQIEAVISNSKSDDVTEARLHQEEISKTLSELGLYDQEMEASPFENSKVNVNLNVNSGIAGMLNIDILIHNKNKKVALEFIGPGDCVKFNGREVENGRKKLKRKLLGKLGFSVVGIYWDEWRRARGGGTQKELLRGEVVSLL